MSEIVEKVRKHMEEECKKESNFFGMDAYTHHFISVVKYAKQLAKERGADMEIVEISAWLHDIGSIYGDYDNHHVSGGKYSEKILLEYGYPLEKIEKVKHCILAHRGSRTIARETVEAECIADADALSHFDNLSSLFNLALVRRKLNIDDAKTFVRDKLERSWNKLTPKAKEIIKSKYEAAMLLLKE